MFYPKMDKTLREVIIKVMLVIVALLFITMLLTKRFIYFHPSSELLPVAETYRVVNQGHLHGWFAENEEESPVVLLCHGHTGNISYFSERIQALHRLGYSVLAFDYSGFGKSSGIPSEQQLFDDASSMMALLLRDYLPENIILYGQGLGASVATYAARRYQAPILILESPFPSIRTIINHTLLKFLASFFTEFDTLAYLDGYRGKSLMLYSTTDMMIPFYDTLVLQKLCSEIIVVSGSHNNLDIPWERVKQFIEKTKVEK